MISKKASLFIGCLILMNAVFVGIFEFHAVKEKSLPFSCRTTQEKPPDFEVRKCWSDRIGQIGVEVAGRDFEAWNKQYDLIQQHVYAHEFGGILYAHTGTAGLKFCSMNFQYGCFHEFIGKAIHSEGLGILGELNKSCRKNLGTHALGCQHGIGHGIQSVLGYEYNDFLRGLSICKGLPYNDPISGCYAGVVMEYSMRTILSAEGGSVLPMVPGKEDLCAPLPKEYLASCYYQLPEWWYRVLRDKGLSGDAVFAQIGDWCRRAVKGGQERCFRGIGNIITSIGPPSSVVDLKKSISICRQISAGNHLAFKYCVEDIANSFNVNPETRKEVQGACGVLTGGEVRECEIRVGFNVKFDPKSE